jgi:hypothetical protein
MNEEQFNTDLRKFLKHFGVTAQREIEQAVRKAAEEGALDESRPLKARAKLQVDGIDVDFVVDHDIRLS